MSSPAFSNTLRRAASVVLGGSMAAQVLRLISSLVLTRLLVPEAFGLVAAVQAVYLGLVLFSDLGVWQSVVTAKSLQDPRLLGTALSIQLLRGLLLAGVVLAIAFGLGLGQTEGWITVGVYADPRLPWMMAVFAGVALVQGGESLKLALAQRELQVGRLARLELLSQVLGMVVTIVLAAWTRSVWSLLAGTVVAASARTLLSHLWLPGPAARLAWAPEHVRHIVGFGKWVFLSSIIGFAAAHGEKLLLGGLLDAPTFGLYAVASTLLAALVAVVGAMNAQLIFPALSEAVRQGPQAARETYLRMQGIADLVLGGLCGMMFTAGAWAVWILYDPRYALAGELLGWLGLGLLGLRLQVLEQMMFARSRPHWVTLNNALRALAIAVGVPLGHQLGGLVGAMGAIALAQYAGWPTAWLYRRLEGLPQWRSERLWPLALVAGLALGWGADALLGLWLPRG